MGLPRSTEHHPHLRANLIFYVGFEYKKIGHNIRIVHFDDEWNDTLMPQLISSDFDSTLPCA
jgi:hypothetical protein